jgi:hypothetical protein
MGWYFSLLQDQAYILIVPNINGEKKKWLPSLRAAVQCVHGLVRAMCGCYNKVAEDRRGSLIPRAKIKNGCYCYVLLDGTMVVGGCYNKVARSRWGMYCFW